ncbi:hypothetical protein H5185_12380 [Shewanella sp. SG44-6]|uniref:JAB domain-containing protein n=1 Tax=Shewanella sp. SG44-6 TaxID=2760959 RepID=UPI0016013E53|nr:hypothetical protein [Shewanella sp. SG44-6]
MFAHNHPTGNSTPSNADIRITKRLEAALNTVDISVLDHIIFGKGESASLKQLKHF